MKSFMVIARFKDGATQDEIKSLIPAEVAQAKLLEEKGLIGIIKVAMPKRTVFLEAFAESEAEATESIKSLPMSVIWDFELFETTPPAGVALTN
ncbi:hypothetical protein MCERE8_01062 [Candidatus Nanopelagicaceae bacterium]|jgi:hypothetical protein